MVGACKVASAFMGRCSHTAKTSAAAQYAIGRRMCDTVKARMQPECIKELCWYVSDAYTGNGVHHRSMIAFLHAPRHEAITRDMSSTGRTAKHQRAKYKAIEIIAERGFDPRTFDL